MWHGWRRWLGLVVALVVLIGSVAGYFAFWHHHVKRFDEVHPGVLYRVAQPTEFGLRYLVNHYHVKTVLSLQLDDRALKGGLIGLGQSDGERESAYVEGLGARHVQWPMGEEACWPWMTPWQFEQFFKLFDEPSNLPVAVHCMGGRHRTGTISALFRLEYDRWPVAAALAEMYQFEFGGPIALQEINLRTYLPRPRPDVAALAALHEAFDTSLGPPAAKDDEDLIRRLRANYTREDVRTAFESYLRANRPFALPLAQRLINDVDDPLAAIAAGEGAKRLDQTDGNADSWSAAAALVTDFGTRAEQARLLELIANEIRKPEVTRRYAALVSGIMNRYTPNRQAFLRPVLEDERHWLGKDAAQYRYCDVAVVRLAAINDQPFFSGADHPSVWDQARAKAREWFTLHPEAAQLCRLLPPNGNNPVKVSDGRTDEDLSRMRR